MNSSESDGGGDIVKASLSAQLAVAKMGKTNAAAISSNPIGQKILQKPSIFDDSDEIDLPDLDTKTKSALELLAKNVADYGFSAEEDAKNKHKLNPAYWFLYDKSSEAYEYYRKLILKYSKRNDNFNATLINRSESGEILCSFGQKEKADSQSGEIPSSLNSLRKRKSRWDTGDPTKLAKVESVAPSVIPHIAGINQCMGSTGSIGQLESVNVGQFGSINMNSYSGTSDQQPSTSKLLNDQEQVDTDLFKKQILASQLAAKALAKAAKAKSGAGPSCEYDSDEDTEGGTFEHKRRMQEMAKTEALAKTLTVKAKGKHHIGDFLPLDEMDKFHAALKKTKEAAKNSDKSDFQENKLQADNLGYKMLQKMGWSGKGGLGANEQGITAPVNKGRAPNDMQGLGTESAQSVSEEDDIFDVYRKRMMLAYKFRPNPLNNPRRPYY